MSARRRLRVAVITGTRAEYGLLCSPMRAIQQHPKLELQLVVTGMHLIEKFGHTVDEIVADGWDIAAQVPAQFGRDEDLDQVMGLARGVAGLARFFSRNATDVAVVLGDRIEAFAGAVAAATFGRFVAHIHGGDVAPGDLDEGLRHSITKLAHVHFAATKQSARRILRMGERPEHVHVVGAPGLDDLYQLQRGLSGDEREKRPWALVVQHPCGRSAQRERRTMAAILGAVEMGTLEPVVIYPNSDRGHTGIIEAIEAARRRLKGRLRVERSLSREAYLRLLMQSRVLVGNSSSGIIEAASAGTPAVNVGDRQEGRERSERAVIDCGETRAEIAEALATALARRPRAGGRTCYGDGQAGRRIAELLADTHFDDGLRRKRITY